MELSFVSFGQWEVGSLGMADESRYHQLRENMAVEIQPMTQDGTSSVHSDAYGIQTNRALCHHSLGWNQVHILIVKVLFGLVVWCQ